MKKIVSLVIVITMMLCMLPVSSITASATEFKGLVDLSNETDYPDGGKYTDPKTNITYTVIRTKAKLIDLVKNNKLLDENNEAVQYSSNNILVGNYILAKSISLENTTYNAPIFGNKNIFNGILNGNGFAIYNFNMTYPSGWSYNGGSAGLLFQDIYGSATIENLSVGTSGSYVTSTVNATGIGCVGGIAGRVSPGTAATDTVTISNVNVYCNIVNNCKKESELCVGGIIGKTDRGNSNIAYNVNIKDTNFYGSISFTEDATVSDYNTRLGGMIGYHYSGILDVQCSSNHANIELTNRSCGSKNSYVGGFVGYALREATFTDCTNFGKITTDKYGAGFLGAVNFGDYSTLRSMQYTFNKCVNHGNITAASSGSATAGGIMGYANFGTFDFENCGNTGDIYSTYKNGSTLYASGILGRYWINNTDTSIINCYSTGTISSSSSENLDIYAICNGAGQGNAITVKNCVWNNAEYSGTLGTLTEDSGNNGAKNILAKETADAYEACVQKSNDNTKIRVLLLTETSELDANTNVVVKVWCGNTGKEFTVPANSIFALESVDAAGETYYGVGGAYIFGAVITGIPESVMSTVTDVTVEYGSYSTNITFNN